MWNSYWIQNSLNSILKDKPLHFVTACVPVVQFNHLSDILKQDNRSLIYYIYMTPYHIILHHIIICTDHDIMAIICMLVSVYQELHNVMCIIGPVQWGSNDMLAQRIRVTMQDEDGAKWQTYLVNYLRNYSLGFKGALQKMWLFC